jgi:thioredoxin 1
MALKVNDDNFAEVIKTDKPVVIDCSATWCGPCKALAPIVEELAKDYEGRAVVCTADVEEATELASQFRVRNVPTVLFLKNGVLKDKSVGLVPKESLEEKLNPLL